MRGQVLHDAKGRAAAAVLIVALVGCQHRVSTWRDVARATGCTPELLARSAPYDSTHVRDLAGTYRLVQVDTAHGWVATEVKNGAPVEGRPMRLWVPDSIVAHWRRHPLSRKLIPANRPIVGEVPSYGEKGFTDMNPQVAITGAASDRLVIQYHSRMALDGVADWNFPIERVGTWGFGGYFDEGPDWIIPFGVDGKPLPPRSGYYCALRS